MNDEYLWSRGDFVTVTGAHGPRGIVGAPWKMTRSPVQLEKGAPSLGEHNWHVYNALLGVSAVDFQELQETDVVT